MTPPGFEPGLFGREPNVLPLDDGAVVKLTTKTTVGIEPTMGVLQTPALPLGYIVMNFSEDPLGVEPS